MTNNQIVFKLKERILAEINTAIKKYLLYLENNILIKRDSESIRKNKIAAINNILNEELFYSGINLNKIDIMMADHDMNKEQFLTEFVKNFDI